MNKKISRVGLVIPPIVGHTQRGTGRYTKGLFNGLQKINDIHVSVIHNTKNSQNFDIIHYPYFDPFFLTLPLYKRIPTVVTVHDLIPLKYSEGFPIGIKGFMKWNIQKFSLQRTNAIITDSYASKRDICKFAQISPEKISVIFLGVDEDFKVVKNTKALKSVQNKLKLPPRFLLNVGDVNYNKNILTLLKIYKELNSRHNNLHLVLVGNGFIKSTPQLREVLNSITNYGLNDKVHRYANISQVDLIGIYNLSTLYIQPSLAEGFGLPVLEAMACGSPTVVNKNSSLIEITGTGGILIDFRNADTVIHAIEHLLESKTERIKLQESGFHQVELFQWEKCASHTAEVYRSIV